MAEGADPFGKRGSALTEKLKPIGRIALYSLLALVMVAVILCMGWLWRANRLVDSSEDLAAADGAPGEIRSIGEYDLHVRLYGDPHNRPLLLIHGFDIAGGGSWENLHFGKSWINYYSS